MGFSVAHTPTTTSILAEITLANSADPEVEELQNAEEMLDPELAKTLEEQGSLKGEGKAYFFIPQEHSELTETFFHALPFAKESDKEKTSESKQSNSKEFTNKDIQKNSSPTFLQQKAFSKVASQTKGETLSQQNGAQAKSSYVAQHTLAKAPPPKLHPQKHDFYAIKHQSQARNIEHKAQTELARKEQSKQQPTHSKKESDPSSQRHASRPENQSHRSLEKQQESHEKERSKEEEDGFAEQQKDQNQEHAYEEEERDEKCEKISEKLAQDILEYGAEVSILSQIFDMRVSQFDVLILFFEILRLEIRGREQERIGRQVEREMQIKHMQLVVENYKKQASDLRSSSLTAGLLGIASGLLPIVGFLKGDWILDKLGSIGSIFKNFQGQDPNKVFKYFSQTLNSGSEMQKTLGQIQVTFAEGDRNFDQHMSDLFRTDWEESTRTMEEIKDSWKGIENFLHQSLQMYHDATRQLYN